MSFQTVATALFVIGVGLSPCPALSNSAGQRVVKTVGHVKIGEALKPVGAVLIRQNKGPQRLLKDKEPLYLDEWVNVPKKGRMQYRDRSGEIHVIPIFNRWVKVMVYQPEVQAGLQHLLDEHLDVAIKPRGGSGFLIPGALPMPITYFRFQTALPAKVVSWQLKRGIITLYQRKGSFVNSPDLTQALNLARDHGEEPITLMVRTTTGTLQTDFSLLTSAQEADLIRGFQVAQNQADPVARRLGRAIQFIYLGWYPSAQIELRAAMQLGLGDNPRIQRAFNRVQAMMK